MHTASTGVREIQKLKDLLCQKTTELAREHAADHKTGSGHVTDSGESTGLALIGSLMCVRYRFEFYFFLSSGSPNF